jgi:hypothetical protein
VHFVGRGYADATAAGWARERVGALDWVELSPVKWVAELGAGPVTPGRPDVVCRRVLVRATGARHRLGVTAIVTDLPGSEVAAADLEPFYEARQTVEGWLSEACRRQEVYPPAPGRACAACSRDARVALAPPRRAARAAP